MLAAQIDTTMLANRLRLGMKGALLRFYHLLDKAEQEEKKTNQ